MKILLFLLTNWFFGVFVLQAQDVNGRWVATLENIDNPYHAAKTSGFALELVQTGDSVRGVEIVTVNQYKLVVEVAGHAHINDYGTLNLHLKSVRTLQKNFTDEMLDVSENFKYELWIIEYEGYENDLGGRKTTFAEPKKKKLNGELYYDVHENILLGYEFIRKSRQPSLVYQSYAEQKKPTSTVFENTQIGKPMVLNNILFELGTAELVPASFAELDKLAQFLKDNPNAEILLEGHTDIIGEADKNLKLSEDRVKAIQTYLASKSIDKKRIQLKWYGDTKPLMADKTRSEEERKANRRVEITVLKK